MQILLREIGPLVGSTAIILRWAVFWIVQIRSNQIKTINVLLNNNQIVTQTDTYDEEEHF